MTYELCTYTVTPGRTVDLNRHFADVTLGSFEQCGVGAVGFWTNAFGGSSDQPIDMLSYESLVDREQKRSAFARDRARLDALAETERNGPVVKCLTAQTLRPPLCSPMQ